MKSLVLLVGLALVGTASSCRQQSTEPVVGEPVQVEVSLSTNLLHIGDAAQLHISVQHPVDGTLQLPDFNQEKSLIVRDARHHTDKISDTRANTIYTIDFTSFATGRHVVATNQVTFRDSDTHVLEIPFPFTTFDVVSMLESNVEARGGKAYVLYPHRVPRWLIVLLVVAGLALPLSLLIVYSARKLQPAAEPEMPPVPPDVLALARLKRLSEKGFIASLNHEPYYVELSDIVRQYLEQRFTLQAPEQTTEEFIRSATTAHVLSTDHQKLTHSFLEQCDLVKFARFAPDENDMQAAFAAAKKLVLETRSPGATEEAA